MKTIPAFTLILGCILANWSFMYGQNQASSGNLLDFYYQSINKQINLTDRINASQQMLFLSKEKKVDSLLSKSYLLLCDLNSKQNQFDSAFYYSEKLINYAKLKKDTSLLVKGLFRQGYYLKKKHTNLKAFNAYALGVNFAIAINDSISASKMLSNMAVIQNDIGDFYGAQASATKGLIYLTKENTSSEYLLTNSLALAFSNCKDYKNAEQTYLTVIRLSKTPQQKAMALNNLALVYRNLKEYPKAITTFSEGLKDSANINKPETVARLKDNMGYTLFQQKENKGLEFMLEALKQRKEIEDHKGQFASNIHLINYYFNKDTNKSIYYANNALQVAKKVKSPDMSLEALSYIVQLDPNKENTSTYVALNDSITTAKLLTQNKYAGILFKTEEKEKNILQLQKENLTKELQLEKEAIRKWSFGIGLLVVLIISFFIWRKYKAETKAKMTITLQKDEIEKQKNEVEELQKELHHRLKNNFTMINFFIDLAKGKFKDKEYQEKLNELQNRIGSMFAIHTQLIKKEDITSVNALTYISSLVGKIHQIYQTPFIENKIIIKEDEVLATKLSFPIGLIINEFVTNSYKYAFPNKKEGTISIAFHSDKENYYLTISDNGIGLPDDFDIENLSSFGIDTMKLLTEQYHGKFQLNDFEGVQLKIILPKLTNQLTS